jgi:hypothetical protein
VKVARLGHADTEHALSNGITLLSAVHGPEVVLGMLVAVLHLDVVAPRNCFARQRHIPLVIAFGVARPVLALLIGR